MYSSQNTESVFINDGVRGIYCEIYSTGCRCNADYIASGFFQHRDMLLIIS